MKKNVLGFLAMVLCACSEPVRVSGTPVGTTDAGARDVVVVEPEQVRYEATTVEFCRPGEYEFDHERHRALTRQALTEMANEGWEYQGIIHNDGINCSVVYFRRPARPCANIADSGADTQPDAESHPSDGSKP